MVKLNRKVSLLLLVTVFLAVSLVYGDDEGIVVEEAKKDTEHDLKVIKEDLTKQLPALVSGLFSSFRSASPALLLTSAIVGALITTFMLNSPLSPLPVPPLPYPPFGRYPPTEMAIPVLPPTHRDQHNHRYQPVDLGSRLRPTALTLDKKPITSYNHFGNNLRRYDGEMGVVNPYGGRSARNEDIKVEKGLQFDTNKFEEFMDSKKDYEALTNEQLRREERGHLTREPKHNFKYYFQEALRVLGEFLLELEKTHHLYPNKNASELCTDELNAQCNHLT